MNTYFLFIVLDMARSEGFEPPTYGSEVVGPLRL